MREKSNNSGYTMVEMIIVIAIIAIMSGMAGITVGAIRTSQATSAMQRFDNELSALEMRAKSLNRGNAICIVRNAKGDSYNVYYGIMDDTGKFTPDDASKADAVLERVTIYYSDSYDADASGTAIKAKDITDDEACIISIRNSDGKIKTGSGEYKFVKYGSGSDASVGRVVLNGNTGGHTYGRD